VSGGNPPVSPGRSDNGTMILMCSGRMPEHDPHTVVLCDLAMPGTG
jgi:hypothetical protein